jgi:uncharacterized protein
MARGNPFHYGTPVEGDQFVGRQNEVRAVVNRVRDHVSVVMLSPRRYGKTSVLLKSEAALAPAKAAIIHVNVLRCRDETAFAGALAAGAFRMAGGHWHRTRQALPEFLRRLRLRPKVSLDDAGRPEFSFEPGLVGRDVDMVVSDIFRLLAEEAGRRPAALVLDEFQAVVDLDDALPAMFKGLVDEHPSVSLVTAGSKQHLMQHLFIDRNAPLFNAAERIALGPIPDDEMVAYLRRRASAAGHRMTEGTGRLIVAAAGPVPDDIQHLAYEAFESAEGTEVTGADVEGGLATAVGRLEHLYSSVYELLAAGQRHVLRELALKPTSSPSSGEFVRRTGLANASSVKKALDALIMTELVVDRGGRRELADPFLAAWLRGVGGS